MQLRQWTLRLRAGTVLSPQELSNMMSFHAWKIKGVIFDLDETLIDSLEAFAEAFNRGMRRFGLEPVTKKRVASFLEEGLRMRDMLSEFSPLSLIKTRSGEHVSLRYGGHISKLNPKR